MEKRAASAFLSLLAFSVLAPVVAFAVDLTPPSVFYSAPAIGSTQRDSVTMVAVASDTESGVNRVIFEVIQQFGPNVGQVVFTATSTTPPYQATWDASSAPNGSYAIQARAYDNNGNIGYAFDPPFNPRYFLLDNDVYPPSVSMTSPAIGSIQRDSVTMVAAASDTISGVNRVVFEVVQQFGPNSGQVVFTATSTTPPYQATWNASSAPNGSYAIQTRAYDNKGNVGYAFDPPFNPRYFLLDNDVYPPSVSMTSPAIGSTQRDSVTMVATASDTISGVNRVIFEVVQQFGPNSGQVVFTATSTTPPYQATWNASSAPNGSYAIQTRAYDNKGNVGYAFDPPFNPRYFLLDNDVYPPSVSMTSPVIGSTQRDSVTMVATASDTISGVNRVIFEVVQQFGPNSGQVVFTATSTTPPYQATWDASSAPNGNYAIQTRAFDNKGNTGYAFDPPFGLRQFLLDNDVYPPSVSMTSPAIGSTQRDSVTMVATASDTISGVNRVIFEVIQQFGPNSGQVVFTATATTPPYQATWDASSAPNGNYAIQTRAFDNKGNTGYAFDPPFGFRQFLLDNDVYPPSVSMTSPTIGSTQRDSVTMVATASDTISGVNRVIFEVVQQFGPNSGQVVFTATATTPPYQATWDASVAPNGNYAIQTRAFDNKGNTGYAFDPPFGFRQFLLDNDVYPPSVSMTSPAIGSTQRDSVTMVATASDTISGVNRVIFEVVQQFGPNSGQVVFTATSTTPPYQATWDASSAPNGNYAIQTRAFDNKGNTGYAFDPPFGLRQFLLDNDVYPPSVSMTSPAIGSTQRDSVTMVATASDTISGVNRVIFEVIQQFGPNSGQVVFTATATTPPYQATWDASSAPNGNYAIQTRAFDNKGNTGYAFDPPFGLRPFLLDNDVYPPSVSMSSPQAESIQTGFVTMVAAATDTISGVNRVVFEVVQQFGPNSGQVVFTTTATTPPYQATWDASSAPNGNYAIQTRALDNKGNVGYTFDPPFGSRPFLLINDFTAPVISLVSPTPGAQVQGAAALSATASDDTGVTQVVFSVDGVFLSTDTTSPYQASWNTLGVVDGTHTVTATAYDGFGHTSQASTVVSVDNPDVTAPSVAVSSPTNGANLTGVTSLFASASDAATLTVPASGVAGVQFMVDGAPLGAEDLSAPYLAVWNTASGANGAHVLTAVARDAAGNVSTSAAVNVTVFNDLTAPVVSLSSPAANAVLAGTATVAAAASDNVAVQRVVFAADSVAISTDTAAPYQASWATLPVANGTHTLTATAYDAAGFSSQASVPVTVANPDVTKPVVSLTAPAAGAEVAGTSVTVNASASDPASPTVPASGVAGVQFKLDGANLGAERTSAPYMIVWSSTGASNGTHVLLAQARDAAGNVSISSVSVTVNNLSVKVNFQPSGASVPSGYLADTGAAFGSRGNGFSYGWNAADNHAVDRNSTLSPDQRYDTFNAMQTGGTFRWEIALPSGRYQVRVVAGDAGSFNSVYRINAENVLAVNAAPSSSSRWKEGTVTVDVTDGRLTLANASGASNNKICFVDISRVGPAGSALAAIPLSPSAAPASGSKAHEKFLSPGLADGINDAAVFGPEAESLTIVDVNGRLVFEASRLSDAEDLSWNARDRGGELVESGVYVVRIREKGGAVVYQTLVVAK